ncbi:MAG TPA: hypothetical protein V6D22_04855, partial [Candidatus Obscuribacterales bacterium]
AFHLLKHTDDAQPQPMVLHTAAKAKVIAHTNAFQIHSHNPFSKRNRYLKRLERATKTGGNNNPYVPFQNSMWSPRFQKAKLTHGSWWHHSRNGTPARAVAARPKRRWKFL